MSSHITDEFKLMKRKRECHTPETIYTRILVVINTIYYNVHHIL